MPVFANPLGLLALLGIPVVLAIHFLQRKARELPVSTLFLLDHTRREAAGGRRFERLLPSIPLWMQLLAVLLLSWFLAEPRYQKAGSVQRVAVVIDSSASMGVFKEAALRRLGEMLPVIQGSASGLQLTLLESTPNRPRIYAGGSAEELRTALADWQPRDGPVDPAQALRLARSLVSREGTVLYLTDTPGDPPPFDARLVAVGEPMDNVGFTGVSFATEEGSLVWRAMVRNHGKSAAERTWTLRTSTGASEPRPLRLEPGGLITLQAAFPKDAGNVRVELSGDHFAMDDVMPLVAPKPKLLRVFAAASPAFGDLAAKLTRSLEETEAVNDAGEADLTITSYNPLDPVTPEGSAVIFVEDETRTGAWLKGGIVAEAHPLMDGLNWQSLLARETIQLEQGPDDRVLLWQDKRSLILLRESGARRQLLFNFDPGLSNADKQPAFVVLLHRFAETLRQAKVAPVSQNLETGQPIRVTAKQGAPLAARATDPAGKPLAEKTEISAAHAIPVPGFQQIRQGETLLMDAAVHFGDPREADLTVCGSTPFSDDRNGAVVQRHTLPDPWWRVWILLLLAALLVSWKFTSRQPSAI